MASTSDWIGTAAEVFSALGTVGAFIIGFILLRGQHRRETERAEDERRSQAARISAWVEAYRKPDGGREIAFHIHNASDMPIYEVELPQPNEDQTEFIGLVPQAKPSAAPHHRNGYAPTSTPNPSRSNSSTAPASTGPATNRANSPALRTVTSS